eukprot:TRINITY_DN40239_c0_g1_i1.p1 TRINITY_DN40239_c0_g1~~TRINITY_DN40239_c0_g1_i1.p1  ORF type:complete len:300 (+),score=34.35 TRINITY_DN40239_c0_g1_i1:360-1259(+)
MGIVAKDPYCRQSLQWHCDGGWRPTQFISMTKSPGRAAYYALWKTSNPRKERVCAIDVSKLTRVYDISTLQGLKEHNIEGKGHSFAYRHKELCTDEPIPPDAILATVNPEGDGILTRAELLGVGTRGVEFAFDDRMLAAVQRAMVHHGRHPAPANLKCAIGNECDGRSGHVRPAVASGGCRRAAGATSPSDTAVTSSPPASPRRSPPTAVETRFLGGGQPNLPPGAVYGGGAAAVLAHVQGAAHHAPHFPGSPRRMPQCDRSDPPCSPSSDSVITPPTSPPRSPSAGCPSGAAWVGEAH